MQPYRNEQDADSAAEDNPKNELEAGDKVVIAFDQEIQAGKLLTRHKVRTKMHTDTHLWRYVVKPEKVKKICDFLRYRTNRVRQLMYNEGEGDDKSKIATFSTGSRRQWDGNATKAIEDQFLHKS